MNKHRKMRKGIGFTVGTILYMVLIIGVAALVFLILSQIDVIKAWLFGQYTDELSEAVKCAYYRCTEGCSEAENKVNEKFFDCSAYCTAVPGIFRPNNKICGFNSIQYPVEITLTEKPKTYPKEIGGINFECIVPLDTPQFKSGWEMLKVGGASVGAMTACIASSMVPYAPIVVCPIAIGSLLILAPKYEMLVVDPDLIYEPSDRVECTPSTGENTYEALDVFEPLPGSQWYIFADKSSIEIEGVYKFTDVKTVTAISIQPYTIIPQTEEVQLQLVRENWNRIIFEGVGDIGVKPRYAYAEGVISAFWGLDVSCLSGEVEEKIFDVGGIADCKAGYTFCDGKFSIRCFDVDDKDQLVFYVGYGDLKEGAELFTNTEFKGSYVKLSEDTDITTDLDNEVSSVKVPAGWELTLYDEPGHSGQSVTIAGDSSYLVHCKDNWWEFGCPTHVSSIKFDKTGCSATVYKEEDFQEEYETINSDVSNLEGISGPCDGSWNDCINSIKVEEGCKATLYSKPDFDQYYITVSGDSSNIHFDNKASSLIFNIPEI